MQATWDYYRRSKLSPITLFQVPIRPNPTPPSSVLVIVGGPWLHLVAAIFLPSAHACSLSVELSVSRCCPEALAARAWPLRGLHLWGASSGKAASLNLFAGTTFCHLQILRSVHADDEKYKAVVSHLIDVGLLSSEREPAPQQSLHGLESVLADLLCQAWTALLSLRKDTVFVLTLAPHIAVRSSRSPPAKPGPCCLAARPTTLPCALRPLPLP